MKSIGIFFLFLIVSIPLHAEEPGSRVQNYRDEIDSLLNKLVPVEVVNGKDILVQGPSSETQQQVPYRLLQIANESAQSRSEVIEALIRVLEKPASEEQSLIAPRWTAAVDLLGDLAAKEAIDILVKNLDQTGQNLIVISIHCRPVARAIAKIGEPAVPRLIEALADEDPEIRQEAASTLASIGNSAFAKLKEALQHGGVETKGGAALALAWLGGEEAKAIIERAIEVETDPQALSKLKDALEELHRHWGN